MSNEMRIFPAPFETFTFTETLEPNESESISFDIRTTVLGTVTISDQMTVIIRYSSDETYTVGIHGGQFGSPSP